MLSNPSAPSFFKQELAHFSNDQRFVYYEHVVVGVMHFDDSRVLHAWPEALDRAFDPVRQRLDVAIEFLLLGNGTPCWAPRLLFLRVFVPRL